MPVTQDYASAHVFQMPAHVGNFMSVGARSNHWSKQDHNNLFCLLPTLTCSHLPIPYLGPFLLSLYHFPLSVTLFALPIQTTFTAPIHRLIILYEKVPYRRGGSMFALLSCLEKSEAGWFLSLPLSPPASYISLIAAVLYAHVVFDVHQLHLCPNHVLMSKTSKSTQWFIHL